MGIKKEILTDPILPSLCFDYVFQEILLFTSLLAVESLLQKWLIISNFNFSWYYKKKDINKNNKSKFESSHINVLVLIPQV